MCDFEDRDFCNWQNLNKTDDFDWLINSGPTPTFGTGPSSDHTKPTEKGYYIYLESSYPNTKGQKAQLLSEPMLNSDDGCALFWYHMYGSSIGTLNLYLTVGQSKELIWSLSGEAGKSWLQGVAPFKSSQLHNLMFEGIVGSGSLGDIALDDISIRRESCQVQPQIALPQLQAAYLVECNFENQTLCNWNNEVNATLKWTIAKGQTDTFGETGPTSGARNSIYYLYVDSKSRSLFLFFFLFLKYKRLNLSLCCKTFSRFKS